ncbi:5'-3' exoribonuclease [Artemisia annua]|uniref:5'-3' exoribonuclease n=1 Tax=Artemisia annua TaxID=35608 RepID=A0A2U1QCT8_ARTAN|nr:5'-3' exoribonuclease [Artemisia annua]
MKIYVKIHFEIDVKPQDKTFVFWALCGAAIVEAMSKFERDKSDAFNFEQPEEDKIKLRVAGWKERYYEDKLFGKSPEDLESLRSMNSIGCAKMYGLVNRSECDWSLTKVLLFHL